MNLKENIYNNHFSHIYVEKNAMKYKYTNELLNKFKNAKIILIDNYKAIFSANNQNFKLQKKSNKLILAEKKESLLYEGANVCENFGFENFYYTSFVINCIYDCEYCYLQGVYPSANIVIFVNFEDVFKELEKKLKKEKIYLCISYDTDLLAIDNLLNVVEKWYNFCLENENLFIELRTKSNNVKIFEKLNYNERFIIAFTLSPEEVIKISEFKTPSLEKRVEAIKILQSQGKKVRLCFDPLIYFENFEKIYSNMITYIFEENKIDKEKIKDVSIGVFRISKDYIKNIKKININSKIVNYPFSNIDGVYTYSDEKSNYIKNFIKEKVQHYIDEDLIFIS